LLVFQDAAPRSLAAVSPWIDARFRGSLADLQLALSNQRHRRFLKSHLPVDGLPLYDNVRYIHVARDGRDAIMSMHNHFSGLSASQLAILSRIGVDDPDIGRPFPRVPADPAEYFREWICIPAVVGQTDRGKGGARYALLIHRTDSTREWAYDRDPSIAARQGTR
jgi:aryl sulfotransferase